MSIAGVVGVIKLSNLEKVDLSVIEMNKTGIIESLAKKDNNVEDGCFDDSVSIGSNFSSDYVLNKDYMFWHSSILQEMVIKDK